MSQESEPRDFSVQPGKERVQFADADDVTRLQSQQYGLLWKLENHEGRLTGLDRAFAALQSAFGSLQTSVSAMLTALAIGFTVVIALVTWTNIHFQSRTDEVREDVQSVSAQVGSLEAKVEALPAEIAAEQEKQRGRR